MKTERREAHTLEDAVEVGLLGVEVDPTPNEHYTVAGVIAGKPTPETDADAAAAAGVTFGGSDAPAPDAAPKRRRSSSSRGKRSSGSSSSKATEPATPAGAEGGDA